MGKKRKTATNDACSDRNCPMLMGAEPSVAPPGCECGRNAELGAILASTLDPLVTIDSGGTIVSASNSVERVFGWGPEQLVGRNVRILMPQPHRTRHNGYLAKYRRTLKTNILGRTREFEGIRKDGTRFPIELSVSRADVPGQRLPMFVGVIRDISQRKAIERELEVHRHDLEKLVRDQTRDLEATNEQLRLADRLAAIGTLAAGLGHDMNNVLLPVRAHLNALESMKLSKEAGRHLSAVRKSCSYLQQLTDGLHMLALNPEDNDFGDVNTELREWWNTVGGLLAKAVPKGVRFDAKIGHGLPRVPVAAHKLTQTVLNLIVNAGDAIQSMHKRRRHAAVRLCAELAPDGQVVRLCITDNGPGMTPEVRARAFDAFFTTKTRGLGTGLGLSLVRSVVVAAGGTIDLTSTPGKGTQIALTLPPVRGYQAESSTHMRRATVSLVDRRAASMAAHILEGAGWHVRRTDELTPGKSLIWITEPKQRALAVAKRHAARGRTAIVVVGRPHRRESWTRLGAFIAEDPGNFDALRDGIGRAIRAVESTNNA